MKLVVKEQVNIIAEPIIEEFSVVPEIVTGREKIDKAIGLQKGDILVYVEEGILARLPVGSDGQVLTADSSELLGVKWANPT